MDKPTTADTAAPTAEDDGATPASAAPPDGAVTATSTSSEAPASSAAATTTTTLPARPTGADLEVLTALQGWELAGRDLLRGVAAAIEEADPAPTTVPFESTVPVGTNAEEVAAEVNAEPREVLGYSLYRQLGTDHEQWGSSLSALLGTAAPQAPDEAVVAEWQPRFDGASGTELAQVALEFETAGLTAWLEAIAGFESTHVVTTSLAIARVAAEHCTALADLSGQGDDLDAMLGTTEVTA